MYNTTDLYYRVSPENTKFYGYRQAFPKMPLVSFDREDREIKELEKRLYEVTGASEDNHVVFEVKVNECILALQFTDGEMCLGLGVVKQC